MNKHFFNSLFKPVTLNNTPKGAFLQNKVWKHFRGYDFKEFVWDVKDGFYIHGELK